MSESEREASEPEACPVCPSRHPLAQPWARKPARPGERRTCSAGCDRRVVALGLCDSCYRMHKYRTEPHTRATRQRLNRAADHRRRAEGKAADPAS